MKSSAEEKMPTDEVKFVAGKLVGRVPPSTGESVYAFIASVFVFSLHWW